MVYAGTCRHKGYPDGALRIAVPRADILYTDLHYGPQRVNLTTHCGDFILRRRDGAWAYQLAVVVDDALTGVSEVVRGRDLLLSAAQQIFLHRALGYTPPQYGHLPLLINAAGQRLSKRDRSLDLGALRQRYTAPGSSASSATSPDFSPTPKPSPPRKPSPSSIGKNYPPTTLSWRAKNNAYACKTWNHRSHGQRVRPATPSPQRCP